MAKRDIWSGKEPFLKDHDKYKRNIPVKDILIVLFIVLLVLIISMRFFDNSETQEDSLKEDITALDESEDLSEYEGLSTRELLDKLYKERGLDSEPAYPVKEFTITAKKYIFDPSIIEVDKNDIVKLTIKSLDDNHTIRIPSFFIQKTVNKGKSKTVEFHADRAGEFVIESPTYNQMRGKVVVLEE